VIAAIRRILREKRDFSSLKTRQTGAPPPYSSTAVNGVARVHWPCGLGDGEQREIKYAPGACIDI
jgi:hypothetical protein